MSKSIKFAFLAGLIGLVAACSQRVEETQVEEFVIVEPEPISVEPVFTGKFK